MVFLTIEPSLVECRFLDCRTTMSRPVEDNARDERILGQRGRWDAFLAQDWFRLSVRQRQTMLKNV